MLKICLLGKVLARLTGFCDTKFNHLLMHLGSDLTFWSFGCRMGWQGDTRGLSQRSVTIPILGDGWNGRLTGKEPLQPYLGDCHQSSCS